MSARFHKFLLNRFWWIIGIWAVLTFAISGIEYILAGVIVVVVVFIFMLLIVSPNHDDWFDTPKGPY